MGDIHLDLAGPGARLAIKWGKIAQAAAANLSGYVTTGGLTTALGSYVPASRTLTAGTGLQGGGSLAANRTFSLTAAVVASLAKADTATQPADLAGRTITGGGLVTGGGTLAASRVLSVTPATNIEAIAATRADVVLTPSNLPHILQFYTMGTRTITTSGLATGGGDFSANRVINVPKATATETTRGLDDTKAVTPLALAPTLRAILQTQGRPGDAPSRYSVDLAGDGLAGAPAPGAVAVGTRGAVLRITGAASVGTRERIGLEAPRRYRLRFAVTRNTDPTDPAGDTVRFGVFWAAANKDAVSGGPQSAVIADRTLRVADGRVTVDAVIASAPGDGVDIVWPASAIYATPYIATYGLDGITDLEVISWADATDLPDADIVAAQVLEILAPQIEQAEQAVADTQAIADGVVGWSRGAIGLTAAMAAMVNEGYDGVDETSVMAKRGVIFDIPNNVFRWGSYLFDKPSVSAKLAVSRASIAYALNLAGKYQQFAINAPRVTDRGVVIEGAATNLSNNPVTFTTGNWPTSNGGAFTITATPGQAPAMDEAGGYTGTVRTVAHVSAQGVTRTSITGGNAATGRYTYSIVLKKGDSQYNRVFFGGGFSQTPSFSIDWTTGTPVIAAISGANVTSEVETIGNGLFRLTFSVVVGTAGSPISFSYQHTATLGAVASAPGIGHVIGTFYHEQLVTGGTATSPIFAAGGTRAAETAVFAIPAGSTTDKVLVTWEGGGLATVLRSKLISPTQIDLLADAGTPWAGKLITSISLIPHFDESLIAPTPNGSQVYMLSWNGNYYADGVWFASEADMLAALGASLTSYGIKLNGFVEPDAPNLAPVDFTVDTQRFNVPSGAATLGISGGYLTMTMGSTGIIAVARSFLLPAGRCYRVDSTIKQAAPGDALRLAAGTYNSSFGIANFSPGVTSTVDTNVTVDKSSNEVGFFSVGFQRAGSGQNGAVHSVKINSIKEVRPARNFPNGAFWALLDMEAPASLPVSATFTASISGTLLTPSGVVGTIAVGQFVTGAGVRPNVTITQDNGDGTWTLSSAQTTGVAAGTAMKSFTREIVSDGRALGQSNDLFRTEFCSNGDVRVTQRTEGAYMGAGDNQSSFQRIATQAGLTAGLRKKVAIWQNLSRFGVAVGGAGQEVFFDGCVGFSEFTLGASAAATLPFSGEIYNYVIYAGVETLPEMVRATATIDPLKFWWIGDSFSPIGSTGVTGAVADAMPDADIISKGVGGSTSAQQVATATDANNLADYKDRTLAWWDADPNGRAAVCNFTATIAGNVLTVSAVSSGALAVDQLLSTAAMSIAPGTFIAEQLTGTAGSAGTYRLTVAQTVASGAINAYDEFNHVKTVLAAIGHTRFLYVRSGLVGPNRNPTGQTLTTTTNRDSADMLSIFNRVKAVYGAQHVYDPFDVFKTLGTTDPALPMYAADQSDIAFGFLPRSITTDGTHINGPAKVAIAPSYAKAARLAATT